MSGGRKAIYDWDAVLDRWHAGETSPQIASALTMPAKTVVSIVDNARRRKDPRATPRIARLMPVADAPPIAPPRVYSLLGSRFVARTIHVTTLGHYSRVCHRVPVSVSEVPTMEDCLAQQQ